MPLYTNQVARYGSHIGAVRDKREKVNEYREGPTDQRQSVYSPHAVIVLRQSYGTCAGCKSERDLINGYCEVCRCCGANERQCLNPRGIAK